MNQLSNIFPNTNKLILKSALILSNQNVNTACLIITSKNISTQLSLFQNYNKMLTILNFDILSNISTFLNLYDNIKLFYSNSCSIRVLNNLPILKKNMSKSIRIIQILSGYFSSNDTHGVISYKKNIHGSILTFDHHLGYNLIGKSKEDTLFLEQITNSTYIPNEYKNFINLLYVSKHHYRRDLIILNYKQINHHFVEMKYSCCDAVPLIGKYFGMGNFYFISFINNTDNNNTDNNNFIISCLGGPNGQECNHNYYNYRNMSKNDLKKYDFESCLKFIFSNHYIEDSSVISTPSQV